MSRHDSDAAHSLKNLVLQGHRPEAQYVYRDRSGEVVGAVARYSPGTLKRHKTFRQFRWSGDGFDPGLNGCRLPLYRLPELADAIERGETVFVAEGEKDVESLRSLGLAATCNAGGAGKWRDDHSKELTTGDVVVLMDNDDAGHHHGKVVATTSVGAAQRIRVIDLPGLPPKGDVSDWLEAGHDLSDLQELVEAAPDFENSHPLLKQWPEPTPFRANDDPCAFPLESALPGFLREVALEISASARVDVAAPSVLIPAVLSAAAGNAWRIRISTGHAEGNLARYAMCVAEPGERKSSVFRHVASPLSEWTESKLPEYRAARESHEIRRQMWEGRKKLIAAEATKLSDTAMEGLLDEALELHGNLRRKPCSPRLFLGDTTPEYLVRRMSVLKGAFAMLSPDARQLADIILGRYRRNGGSDVSALLLAHAGDPIDRGRIGGDGLGESLSLTHPSLALGICIQPDILDALADRSDLHSSGFLARCNITSPRSTIGYRLETGDEPALRAAVSGSWKRIVWALADARYERCNACPVDCLDPEEIALDPEAQVLRRDFANQLEVRQRRGGDLERVRGFASKAAGEAARLAALLHLADLALREDLDAAVSTHVPAQLWQIAEEHQRWQLAETLRCLNLAMESPIDRSARAVLSWATQKVEQRRIVTARDIVIAHKTRDVAEARLVMNRLVDLGWARLVPPASGQRAERWELHPQTFESGDSAPCGQRP